MIFVSVFSANPFAASLISSYLLLRISSPCLHLFKDSLLCMNDCILMIFISINVSLLVPIQLRLFFQENRNSVRFMKNVGIHSMLLTYVFFAGMLRFHSASPASRSR